MAKQEQELESIAGSAATDEAVDAPARDGRDQPRRGDRARRRGRRRGRSQRDSAAQRKAVGPVSPEPHERGGSSAIGNLAKEIASARHRSAEVSEQEASVAMAPHRQANGTEASQRRAASAVETSEEERFRAAAKTEAMLSGLRHFEGALVEAGAELDRIKGRIDAAAAQGGREQGRRRRQRPARSDTLGRRDRLPDGALLVATRLASEGRSREEVRSFLKENFSGIDLSTVTERAFRTQSAEA